MKTIFINTENSKVSEPHKLFLNLSQRSDLTTSNKHYLFITRGKILLNCIKIIN